MKQNLDACLFELLPFMVPTHDEYDSLKQSQLKEVAKMKQLKQEKSITPRFSPY
jgi:hypothetical protein